MKESEFLTGKELFDILRQSGDTLTEKIEVAIEKGTKKALEENNKNFLKVIDSLTRDNEKYNKVYDAIKKSME